MPRIKTTRTVTFALFLLRIYLLAMLLIILTKFVIEARKRNHDAGGPAATGQSAAPAESPGIVFSPFTNERKSTRGGAYAKAQSR
jgi:hypothetical protein